MAESKHPEQSEIVLMHTDRGNIYIAHGNKCIPIILDIGGETYTRLDGGNEQLRQIIGPSPYYIDQEGIPYQIIEGKLEISIIATCNLTILFQDTNLIDLPGKTNPLHIGKGLPAMLWFNIMNKVVSAFPVYSGDEIEFENTRGLGSHYTECLIMPISEYTNFTADTSPEPKDY